MLDKKKRRVKKIQDNKSRVRLTVDVSLEVRMAYKSFLAAKGISIQEDLEDYILKRVVEI